MSNKHVELLMEAVAKMQADIEWLKRGQLGLYGAFGVGAITVVTTLLLR
jgi:hypothetical protein